MRDLIGAALLLGAAPALGADGSASPVVFPGPAGAFMAD
ncbi:hypothetical protein GGQ62_003167 [Polymorphobacter fuscus]|nr:hypothetical protein [Polymorphobacter fuscus]